MSTYDRIKEEALELFSKQGYDKTSMDEIAKKVGIRKASLYSHLKGKDELFLDILNEVILWDTESLDQLYRLIALAGVRAKLKAVFDYYYHLFRNEDIQQKVRFLYRTLIFPPEHLKDQIKKAAEARTSMERRLVSDIFFEGINSKRIRTMDARDFQGFFFSLVDGLFTGSLRYDRQEYFERAEGLWSRFWESVKAE